jgi:hypothetical protein
MPAPNRQNGRRVTAESVSYREKEGYSHEKDAERQRLRPRKGLAEGGNGEGGRKWLQRSELQGRLSELTSSGRWDCDTKDTVALLVRIDDLGIDQLRTVGLRLEAGIAVRNEEVLQLTLN